MEQREQEKNKKELTVARQKHRKEIIRKQILMRLREQ